MAPCPGNWMWKPHWVRGRGRALWAGPCWVGWSVALPLPESPRGVREPRSGSGLGPEGRMVSVGLRTGQERFWTHGNTVVMRNAFTEFTLCYILPFLSH